MSVTDLLAAAAVVLLVLIVLADWLILRWMKR
jgi:hypothetical protein